LTSAFSFAFGRFLNEGMGAVGLMSAVRSEPASQRALLLLVARRRPRPPAQARVSFDRVLALEADLLLPGHGDPWRG
jgi:hypothetical protein